MNIAIVMLVSGMALVLGYKFYSGFIARVVGVDESRPTPATRINDGVDFVPTKPLVLFGHHFAA
ncbi:MAG: carbon starvation CstA family protein, partial [Bacteroidota bacterium]